jgi:hypothetical protein
MAGGAGHRISGSDRTEAGQLWVLDAPLRECDATPARLLDHGRFVWFLPGHKEQLAIGRETDETHPVAPKRKEAVATGQLAAKRVRGVARDGAEEKLVLKQTKISVHLLIPPRQGDT